MKMPLKAVVWLVVLAAIAFLAMEAPRLGLARANEIPLSDLFDLAEDHKVRTAHWQGDTVRGTLADGTRFTTRVADIGSELGYDAYKRLEASGATVTNSGPSSSAKLLPFIGFLIVPVIFIVIFYYLFVKPAQAGLSASSGIAPPRGTPEERLAKIDELHARGAISDEERTRLRETVLRGL